MAKVTKELLKVSTTLFCFYNRLSKLDGCDSISAMQTIRARSKRFYKRIRTLNLDIPEHLTYTERTLRLYWGLKSNGLFLMDNEMLSKFPFERMCITKGGNINFEGKEITGNGL